MLHSPPFPSGTLWPAVLDRWNHAVATHALRPIETEQQTFEDGGINFQVRQVSSLGQKAAARTSAARVTADPFAPYDPDLFVADANDSHVVLLNKYPVIAYHLLIVTRRFEDQQRLLTPSDFDALAVCMAELDGLAFYNGGVEAGASQAHKHLQIVPPLGNGRNRAPIDPLLLAALSATATPERIPRLPFAHRFAPLDATRFGDPGRAAAMLEERYRSLCVSLAIASADWSTGGQGAPYNLLATRDWMLLVPRTRESAYDISINALGFAGSLFVRDEQQLRIVQRSGPLALLRAVTPTSD